jgi:hypothetical protein
MLPARRFAHGFEWCAGPGFIGLWLLANGAAERMTFGDVNPGAVEAARHAARTLGLEHRCAFHVSDNMAKIPGRGRRPFDLVVGNPPNYYAIPLGAARGRLASGDLRPADPGWGIHAGFYRQIPPYLAIGAQLFVSEVEPWSDTVVLPGVGLWDRRPQPAIDSFRVMVEDAGLDWLGCEPFTVPGSTTQMGMVRAGLFRAPRGHGAPGRRT